MTSLGYDVKNPLVFQILSNLDKNGKGAIDFEEFLDMMTARMVRRARIPHCQSKLLCVSMWIATLSQPPTVPP